MYRGEPGILSSWKCLCAEEFSAILAGEDSGSVAKRRVSNPFICGDEFALLQFK